MQHPKPFYAAVGLQDGDGPGGPSSLSASACPDPLPAVGSLAPCHPPNPDKESFPAPPAGFQMAPCGCFFDPRIYRIEWVSSDFGQSTLYKLTGAPTSPSTYLVEAPHFLKAPEPPAPPPPYPHYQPPPGTPQYLMPYFQPEAAGPEALNFSGEGGPPAVSSELPPPPIKEGPAPPKDKLLLITVPGDPPLPPSTYSYLKGRLSQLQGPEPAPRPPEPLLAPGKEPLPPPPPPCAGTGPGAPDEFQAAAEADVGEAARPPLGLPEKVLLEDAMKLFDCLPGVEAEGRLLHKPPAPGPPDCGDGAGADFRALRLPAELLSLDYSVPEVLDTVSFSDYFFSFKALEEEEEDAAGPGPQPPPPPGRKKGGVSAAKKGRQVKAKQVAAPH